MEKIDNIKQWVKSLDAEQMHLLLVELIDFAIDAEMVSFPDLAPYWSHTGDPLIAGQVTFRDE